MDEQCSSESAYGKYAKCDNLTKSCTCTEGARMRRHKCVPVASIGTDCMHNGECRHGFGENTVCDLSQRKCECKLGYTFDEEKNECAVELFGLRSLGRQELARSPGMIPKMSQSIFRSGSWSFFSYFIIACIFLTPFVCGVGYCAFTVRSRRICKGGDKSPLLSVVEAKNCRLPQVTMSEFVIGKPFINTARSPH
jgi:hypothetical protein